MRNHKYPIVLRKEVGRVSFGNDEGERERIVRGGKQTDNSFNPFVNSEFG